MQGVLLPHLTRKGQSHVLHHWYPAMPKYPGWAARARLLALRHAVRELYQLY